MQLKRAMRRRVISAKVEAVAHPTPAYRPVPPKPSNTHFGVMVAAARVRMVSPPNPETERLALHWQAAHKFLKPIT